VNSGQCFFAWRCHEGDAPSDRLGWLCVHAVGVRWTAFLGFKPSA
jgi:hypothetical protein